VTAARSRCVFIGPEIHTGVLCGAEYFRFNQDDSNKFFASFFQKNSQNIRTEIISNYCSQSIAETDFEGPLIEYTKFLLPDLDQIRFLEVLDAQVVLPHQFITQSSQSMLQLALTEIYEGIRFPSFLQSTSHEQAFDAIVCELNPIPISSNPDKILDSFKFIFTRHEGRSFISLEFSYNSISFEYQHRLAMTTGFDDCYSKFQELLNIPYVYDIINKSHLFF
jgi:hypothetical protein